MNTLEIKLEINGWNMDFRVEYTYQRGEQQITHLAPEDCQEGSADEITVLDMHHIFAGKNSERISDAWYLIGPNYEFILEQIREAHA